MGTMGLTPGQKVYALQVFDQLGSGSTSSIVAALNWLTRFGRAKGIRVANMSLGGPKSWAVCAALDAVVRQGITMVVAAGGSPLVQGAQGTWRAHTALETDASNHAKHTQATRA